MNKSAFEEMGGTYRQEGDYLLPNLAVPETSPIGIWGQRRKRYLREHRNLLYTALLLNGELDAHLAEINQQAEGMFFQLVKRMAERESIFIQYPFISAFGYTAISYFSFRLFNTLYFIIPSRCILPTIGSGFAGTHSFRRCKSRQAHLTVSGNLSSAQGYSSS